MTLKSAYEAQRPKPARSRIYFPSGQTVKQVADKLLRSPKTIYNWCNGVKPLPQIAAVRFYELTGHTKNSFEESVREKQGETKL